MSRKSKKAVKEKDLGQSKTVTKKHCSCLPKIKCYLSCVLLFYLIYHVLVKCPNQKVWGVTDDEDFICKSSSKLGSYVSPIIEPVIGKVSTYYRASCLPKYVETADNFVSANYKNYIRPSVEKYGPVVKEKSYYLYVLTLEKTFALWILSKDIAIKVWAFVIENSKCIYVSSREFWVNTGYPKVSSAISLVSQKILYLLRKIGVKIYVEYNIYLAPRLHKLAAVIPNTFIGKAFAHIKESAVVGFVANTFAFLNEIFSWFYDKVSDVFVEFNKKESIFKSSEQYKFLEKKCEFLRNELGNKFFSPGFKIPSYKDLQIFQKITSDSVSKKDEISALSLTISTVATTIAATVTGLSKSVSSGQHALLSTNSLYSSSLPISSELSDTLIQPSETAFSIAIATSEKYEKLTNSVIKQAEEDARIQLESLVSNYSEIIRNAVKSDMQMLSEVVTSGDPEIYKLLHDINRFAKGDEGYVSRQDYRDVLAKSASQIQEHSDNILAILKKTEESYSNDSLEIKNSILETLAQFSESTLAVYSNEIVQKDDDWKEWKKYNDMRKNLLSVRDSISNLKPDGEQKLFNDVTKTVRILMNEGESYLAIMRAKGNIEFQGREHRERLAREASNKSVSSNFVIANIDEVSNTTAIKHDASLSQAIGVSSSASSSSSSSPPPPLVKEKPSHNVEQDGGYQTKHITITKRETLSAKHDHTEPSSNSKIASFRGKTAGLSSITKSKTNLTASTAVMTTISATTTTSTITTGTTETTNTIKSVSSSTSVVLKNLTNLEPKKEENEKASFEEVTTLEKVKDEEAGSKITVNI